MMVNAQKRLPARPSQDSGYGGIPNGYRKENVDPRFGGQNVKKGSTQEPNGQTILQGYGNEISNGFEQIPRYNPSNPSRPQSSNLVNVNDPIQIHLLVETALGDSKEFEILSQEEVDDLKKQCQALTQRIEQTRQNLTIQMKYRDAAISMGKLYTSGDKKKSIDSSDGKKDRRDIVGHNRAGSDQAREAEQERIASERKCEELAADLWSLEKKIMEPQSRLLKHTAGILQMTHKGPKNLPKGQNGVPQNGVPGSPESMFTYSNARNSIEPIPDELFFDDRSLYRPADGFGDLNDSFGGPQKAASREQVQMIAQTEQRLDELNSRLRAVIMKVNPEREGSYGAPPASADNGGKPGEGLLQHLDYLERSISTIDDEHAQALSRSTQASERSLGQRFQESQTAMERRLQESEATSNQRLQESEMDMVDTLANLNHDLRSLLLPYDANRPEPPQVSTNGVGGQLSYFQDSLGALEMELSRATSTASKNSSNQGNLEQIQTVMQGLWDIIQSGDEEERQRKLERKKNYNLADEEESDDDGSDPNEAFSIQGFSAKVQWLYSQATRLKDQKKVLQRQIKQQRELNSKSDATKDAEMAQRTEELERTQNLLQRTETDADRVREQLSSVMEKLDEARQQETLREQARATDESSQVRAAQAELDQKNQTIAALEEELQDLKDDQSIGNAELQGKMAESENKIASLTQELAVAAAAQATFEASAKAKEKEVADKEQEMEDMNMEIARLQTEVTIARAELDGAYGSRAQRAAEVAANPAIQKEIDSLKEKNTSLANELSLLQSKGTANPESDEKVKTLKKELEETIEDYEQMTKASIEWEKEREQLEGTIDKLRDDRERMEAELSDEKVRWLGMKSPGLDGPTPGSTSTTVLKNEFKKMMRDTRAESAKALRAEQAERRKVEDELRALKKAQGPGKSSLSQSIGA